MDGRVRTIVAVAAVGAALLASGSAAASAMAASRSHVWRTAIEVPGTATLNQGGFADSGERHTNWGDRA